MVCSYCGHDEDEDLRVFDEERVANLVKAVAAVYRLHSAGGDLHSIIDDGNTDAVSSDDDTSWFIAKDKKLIRAQKKCLHLLYEATIDERDEALDRYHSREKR